MEHQLRKAPTSLGSSMVGSFGHRARLLTRDMVQQAEIILTMARHHRARVHEFGRRRADPRLANTPAGRDPRPIVSDPFGAISSFTVGRTSSWRLLIRVAVERLESELR